MTRRPVTILGGYLGTGKTTLVNHLLRHAEGRRIAVLVNDFGSTPIDADLIIGNEGGVLSLAGGCICCSYGDDLLQSLMDLATQSPAPDHILIETSGVALPGAVAQALTLLFNYRLDAILVMADAETTMERLADRYMGDTLARQFADADLIAINKCDLAPEAELLRLEQRLAESAPRASVIRTVQSALPPAIVFAAPPSSSHRRALGHATAGAEHHAVVATFDGAVDVEVLAALLPTLGLVRAKGIVISTDGTCRAVQLSGRRVTHDVHDVHNDVTLNRLVCISVGQPIDLAHLAAKLGKVGRVTVQ